MVAALIGVAGALLVLASQRFLDRRAAKAQQRRALRSVSRMAMNNFWWAQQHLERLINRERVDALDNIVAVPLSVDDWKLLAAEMEPAQWRAAALAHSRLTMVSGWPLEMLQDPDARTSKLLLFGYSACERGRGALSSYAELTFDQRTLRVPAGLDVPDKLLEHITVVRMGPVEGETEGLPEAIR